MEHINGIQRLPEISSVVLDVSFWDNTAWSHVHEHSISFQCMNLTHTHHNLSQRNQRDCRKETIPLNVTRWPKNYLMKTVIDTDPFGASFSVENEISSFWRSIQNKSHFSWQPLWWGDFLVMPSNKSPTIFWVASNLILSLPPLYTLVVTVVSFLTTTSVDPPSVGETVLVKPGNVKYLAKWTESLKSCWCFFSCHIKWREVRWFFTCRTAKNQQVTVSQKGFLSLIPSIRMRLIYRNWWV